MTIRIGIGGWTFEPWRGTFFPKGLPHAQELSYASRHVTSIEVNGTYYRTQTPDSFARWHDQSPDGFVFALKGPRYTTNRRVLADAGTSVERFINSGIIRLQAKLGPINWQFLPTKTFDPVDFEAFLKLLPPEHQNQPLRHVVEVRHASFATAEFIQMARTHGVGVVFADSAEFPQLHDVTASFIYARLQRASPDEPSGYPPDALADWATRAQGWAAGDEPADTTWLAAPLRGPRASRDVFIYFINGFKPRAPAAAMALLERLA